MLARPLMLMSITLLSLSSAAFAAGTDDARDGTIAAITNSAQDAAIVRALGTSSLASNSAADVRASDLLNLQQNTGANSVVESANTLALILDCGCAHSEALTAQAKTTQTALVLGDITVRTPFGINTGAAEPVAQGGLSPNGALQSASNSVNGFHGNGLSNISQNTGPNSILQATNNAVVISGNAGVQTPLLSP
jgi:hypothetical protein